MLDLETTAKRLISEAAAAVASSKEHFESCNLSGNKGLLSVGSVIHKSDSVFVTLVFMNEDLRPEWQKVMDFAKKKAKNNQISVDDKARQWRFTFKVAR